MGFETLVALELTGVRAQENARSVFFLLAVTPLATR